MKHVVIIGTQRSGTTVLRSALESHPNFAAFGEVFLNRHAHMKDCFYNYLSQQIQLRPEVAIPEKETNERLFDGYLEYLADLKPNKSVISFYCKYNFVVGALVPGEAHVDQPPFMLQQFWRRGFKIIHLVRRNLLEVHVSSLLSVANQVWATAEPENLKRTITVPTNNLLSVLNQKLHEQKYFSNLISRRDAMTVYYEDLFSNSQFNGDTFHQLAKYCEVDGSQFPVEPAYKKIAAPVGTAIENLDEVKDTLRNTEFIGFLE